MRTIEVLQVGRALAALAVVGHHAALSTAAFSEPVPHSLGRVLSYGYLGVDFFFVLSGFIIYYATACKSETSAEYATRRLRRIFVPYLPVGLALAAAYLALPGLSASAREWSWIATVTLLPSSSPPALSVAWTLQHELVFYGVFGVLLSIGRIGLGMALWSGSIIMANLTIGEVTGVGSYFLSLINLEFAVGVCAAHLVLRGIRLPFLLLITGMVAPLILFGVLGGERAASPLVGLSFGFTLSWLALRELRKNSRMPRALLFLGAASYAIYLVHNPLLSLTSRVLESEGWAATLAGGIFFSIVFGSLYHVLWERPALRRTRRHRHGTTTSA